MQMYVSRGCCSALLWLLYILRVISLRMILSHISISHYMNTFSCKILLLSFFLFFLFAQFMIAGPLSLSFPQNVFFQFLFCCLFLSFC